MILRFLSYNGRRSGLFKPTRRKNQLILSILFCASLLTIVLAHRSPAAIAQTAPAARGETPIAIVNPPATNRPTAPPSTPPTTPTPAAPPAPPPPEPDILPTTLTAPPTAPPKPRHEIRGVWMTTNDQDILEDRTQVREAVRQLKQMNFNTIYPVIWNSGYVMYPSPVAQRADIQPFIYEGLEGQDMLADLLEQAHSQNLLVIPWFEFGFMAPPTSELAVNHPEWLTQQKNGEQVWEGVAGEVVWLNPFHPEVQKFITDLVVEVFSRYDVDGIQFDDHMSLPKEFGYDPYTIALYTAETQNSPPTNPDNKAWVRWRADKITTFMTQLHQAVKAKKADAIFSVSPNYYEFAYKLHLQDWLTWVRHNIVDELIVQVYHSDLEQFTDKITRPEMQETQQKISTGVGIMTGLRNRPVPMAQIQEQVRAVQDKRLGVSFFYYESLWNYPQESISDRQSGVQAFFPRPALRS
jgi:uncharacterized lipoprotein YddW (UPF0748 family)